jgi:tetratricopeptide (TPR) repeat protein
MGVGPPATRTGTVHFAEYEDLPAKKIWSWGVDEEGMDWRKGLSDDDSGYIEIQAGLFRNQETYAFLEPRQSIHFSEFWMPVREIGGISRANLSGVLSLARHGNVLNVGFNANRDLPGATVSILNGSSRLFSEKVDLVPDRAWNHDLPVLDSQTRNTVEIRDELGTILIRQTEGEYDWTPESEIHVGPQPTYRTPDPDQRTCDDWIQLGKDLELNGKNLQAMDTYEETLRRFPGSFGALKSAGRLTASLLRFDEAKRFLEPVHARDTSDPEISYYLGIAYDGLGETRKARMSYEDAQRFASYHPAGALRLGEMLAREGDLDDAERHLSEAVRAAPDDARALEELVAVKIASGKVEEGKTLARQGMALFPLSYFLREELGEPNLKQLGNDSNRVLNLAAQYMRLGLYQRALTVLSRDYPSPPPDQTELGSLSPGQHPMIAYFRGYCRERLGQSAVSDYKIASELSTSYVFPSSAEELTVLSNVVHTNPQDATAQFLLGTLHFSRGLTDLALEEWLLSHKLNPQIPVLDASLGLALLHEKHDAEHALTAFRDGLRSDPANVTVYLGADQALSLLSKPAIERVRVLEKYPNLADAPSSLIFELILNLVEAGDFQRAESLFRNRFFPREEGGTNVRQVWVEVELQKMLAAARVGHCADALVVAENLGATLPDLPFTRDGLEPIVQSARTNYQLGTVYASCAKPEEAAKKFQLASIASAPDQMGWAWQAAQKLPNFDRKRWQARLQSAFTQAKSRVDTSSYPSWWDYTAGALAAALGSMQEADQRFRSALLLPDRMLAYHLTRLARAGAP